MKENRQLFLVGPQKEKESEGLSSRGISIPLGMGGEGGENLPISVSFMGGQPSHKDPQERSQDPRHPMEVVDTTCVLDFEF